MRINLLYKLIIEFISKKFTSMYLFILSIKKVISYLLKVFKYVYYTRRFTTELLNNSFTFVY